jgi:rubrerythrin
MPETENMIIAGLKYAIQMESDGYHFYEMAAKSITDEQGRSTFETLASEELNHMMFLSSQLKSVNESGEVDPNLKLGPKADLLGSKSIFSDELLKKAKNAHFEMSALSIGIRLEMASIEFYETHAREDTDPAVKAFYTELASWESVHYHALLRQQEMLREDYYSYGGFAPF